MPMNRLKQVKALLLKRQQAARLQGNLPRC